MQVVGRRRRKWPKVDVYVRGGMGDIKVLSVEDLDRLMAAAAEKPWSAVGRPEWFRRERENIRRVMLVVLGVEHPSVYRCIVTSILEDGSGGRFTLDVGFSDFNRLPDITFEALVMLAHQYLVSFPFLKLDPSQEEPWKRHENEWRSKLENEQ
jgi:hypothetical protein